VSFAAITLYVASQQVFFCCYFVVDSVRKLLITSSYIKMLVGKPERKRLLGRAGRKQTGSYDNRVGRYELDVSDSEQGPATSSCEHGDEPSDSTKVVEQ
jgi:hypothetical protein